MLICAGLGAFLGALIASGRITTQEWLAYLVLVPSLLIHHAAELTTARVLGDSTAGPDASTSSFGPHIDRLGTLIVPALLILGGIGYFGWTPPIRVDTTSLRSGRNARVVVALSGPIAGVALMMIAAIGFHLTEGPSPGFSLPMPALAFYLLGLTNLWLSVLSLLPIAPLDGSIILERFLPSSAWPRYLRMRPWGLPALLGLALLDMMLHLGIITQLQTLLGTWWSSLIA